jgi:hypothetical protein
MKALILAGLIILTACATTERTEQAQQLRPVSLEDKSKCKFIALITEDETGRGTVGRNSMSAMNNALNKIANSGGDSYFYVSSDTSAFGFTVILEGYKCRGAPTATASDNDSEYATKKQEILKSM